MTGEWRWLESTRQLQEEYFNQTFPLTGDDLADALTENYAALCVEAAEFMQETGWKTWSTPRGWVNRDAAVGELVDLAHFLGNILVHLEVTDDEWEQRYRTKQEVNRNRQRSGYDAREGKCPRCRRSYDDPGVDCRPAVMLPVLRFGDQPLTDVTDDPWCARDGVYVEHLELP